jgi:FAD/FMN-containing dehydrogenase
MSRQFRVAESAGAILALVSMAARLAALVCALLVGAHAAARGHATCKLPPGAAPLQLPCGGAVVACSDAAAFNASVFDPLFTSFELASPLFIAYPRCEADVAAAMAYAQRYALPFSVRSGGHQLNGWCLNNGGVVVSMGDYGGSGGSITPSADWTTVTVTGGVTYEALYAALAPQGRTVAGGTCTTVGVLGHTQAGGYGYLHRAVGLEADHLLEASVMDAQGRVLRVAADENADVFWALRGACGGSFGVVLNVTLSTVTIPASALLSAEVCWEAQASAAVLDAYAEALGALDERVSLSLASGGGGDGRGFCASFFFWGSQDEGALALQQLLARFPPPASNSSQVSTWLEFLDAQNAPYLPLYGHRWQAWTVGVSEWGPRQRRAFLQALAAVPSGACLLEAETMGGQFAAVSANATAFVHRDLASVLSWFTIDGSDADVAWGDAAFTALDPLGAGAYCGYGSSLSAPDGDYARRYWGANLPRLAQVKRAFDPTDFFAPPQGVPPAAAGR